MSSRGEKYDSTDSELDDWKYEYYRDLRDGKERVRVLEGVFRCPYCDHNKTDYDYNDIRRHASRIGNDLAHSRLKDRAKHLGLLRYLDRQVDSNGLSSNSSKNTGVKRDSYMGAKRKSSRSPPRIPKKNEEEELFVWPWMAIVANIPIEPKDGLMVGKSGANHKAEWVAKGFNPVKVQPLWDSKGHSGFEVVLFNRDWDGFINAMMFEKAFEANNRGRKDWWKLGNRDGLYGWIARSEDYNLNSLIGRHLRKHGDLKSVSQIQMEDKVKDKRLVSNLVSRLETKKDKCEEIEEEITETDKRLKNLIEQKDEMIKNYNEELEESKRKSSNQLELILKDHERRKLQLEAEKRELEFVAKKLQEREAHNESKLKQLDHQKKMKEIAILEQEKADQSMLKLAEEQKQEKEKLHKKILELEKQLDAKQALELEIERLRGAKKVMQLMIEEGDKKQEKRLEDIKKELEEKVNELDDIEDLHQALVVKERKTNDEIQEARKELIGDLLDSRGFIRVKRMGDLDAKPFLIAAKRKYEGEQGVEQKGMMLCSTWEEHLKDPSWHPFKVVAVGEQHEEKIDEEDEKLKSLRDEFGDEPYEAVVKALKELNEYNPSGRYPVPELWNFTEGKKATLKEVVALVLQKWKALRGRKK